ncbi:hypothetical protein QFW77_18580 [Luteimonas sp. RD2P54]|uniref:SRPBCC family protein n=1 Tax=Luteimonas endophytica TaxID=3042023 RepID=A0ABT6JED9_9GAMM|nr:hypothetical protein [Luteimonas endophytica]MDH5824977.1 hypothetical protein [Luteimonas endophytica]
MRKPEYRGVIALTLAGLSFAAPGSACEPPAGFVDPPRPDIAPFEELLSVTEENVIDQPLAAVMRAANRPLRIDATEHLAGVSGTYRLSEGPYGSVGARRLVCKTDGSHAVEEVLLTESSDAGSRFRYVVWNYTSPKFRDVAYAVGEFVRTQPAPDRTLVSWTYRFALRDGLGSEDESRFRKTFLEREFPEWMRTQLDRKPAESDAPRTR